MAKIILKAIWSYLFVSSLLLIPVFLILIWFDFVFDLKIDFFSTEYSFFRLLFYVWFLIVNFAYFKYEYWDKIKEII